MYSFPNLERAHCSLSGSNCCSLTSIQISQEARQVVWYSHLFQNFPQFVVIHKVKGFGIVNKAEVNIFLKFSSFFNDSMDVGNLISGSSTFSKSSLNIWKFTVVEAWLGEFFFCFFLVLPLYCYQPISLHPRVHMLSHVIPWTSACQTPLSMGFSRQEYWSGLPFPSP